MIEHVAFEIAELKSMKKYPDSLYYKGDLALLQRRKISMVGSRHLNAYARSFTHTLAAKLAQKGICIVSGGAIGCDAIAHKAAGAQNTIMVAATGLDKRYPAINKNLISEIENEGLILSQFAPKTPSNRYNFPLRNEIVVALGEILIVTYAEHKSGTMHSVEFAKKMGKDIYVLPHRIGESEATNKLLQEESAKAIYDVDAFVAMITGEDAQTQAETEQDPFLEFCRSTPTYEEAYKRFPQRVFEAELAGEIEVINSRVQLTSP